MKKILSLVFLASFGFAQAQDAFEGKGDLKVNIGASLQNKGTGIQASFDSGLAENFSYGFVASYVLGTTEILGVKPEIKDRLDAKIRINANLSSVLNVSDSFDLYPGLSLSLKNFGGHVGARYFFSDGFGMFSEIGFPIAKYDSNVVGFEKYNNQFVFSIGASFNL